MPKANESRKVYTVPQKPTLRKKEQELENEETKTLDALKEGFSKLETKEQQLNTFFNLVFPKVYNHLLQNVENGTFSNFTEEIVENLAKAFQIASVEQEAITGHSDFPHNFAHHLAFLIGWRKKNPHRKTGRKWNNMTALVVNNPSKSQTSPIFSLPLEHSSDATILSDSANHMKSESPQFQFNEDDSMPNMFEDSV